MQHLLLHVLYYACEVSGGTHVLPLVIGVIASKLAFRKVSVLLIRSEKLIHNLTCAVCAQRTDFLLSQHLMFCSGLKTC